MDQLTFLVPAEYDGATVQTFLRRGCGFSSRMLARVPPGGGRHPGGWRAAAHHRLCADGTNLGATPAGRYGEGGAGGVSAGGGVRGQQPVGGEQAPYLAVHPSAGKPEPTLAAAVVGYYQKKGESHAFRPLGRLDRNTSGLLAAAKNAHVAYALGGGKIQKEYRAWPWVSWRERA